MSQAQYSTEEQLAKLRILMEMEEWDVSKLTVHNVRAIIKIANFNGLSNAPDNQHRSQRLVQHHVK